MAQIEAPPSRLSVSASLPVKSIVGKSLDTSNYRSAAPTRLSTPQPLKSVDHSLSPISVEKRLRSALRKKSNDVLAAFRTYDLDGSATITKGELRRVLELFCFPLTSEQFDTLLAKVATSPNGAVRFIDFLADFADVHVQEQSVQPEPEAATESETKREWARPDTRASGPQMLGNANVDLVERLLRERASGNLRGLMKAMQLFDYNRDHKIQRHELRKVIENYCALRLTDVQFDKLWSRYDFYHTGAIDYMDFLRRIGVGVNPSNASQPSRPSSVLSFASDSTVRSLQRPATTLSPAPLDSRQHKLTSITEQANDPETFETLHDMERAFRARFKKQITAIRKAFIAFDTQRDGFVELDDLKAIMREFAMPSLTDAHFAELMRRANIKANGRVPWRTVLSKFEHPLSEHRNGQTLPIRNDTHHFNPVMGASESVALERVLSLLHEQVRTGYSSFKEAFLQMDFNRDGKISRSELRKVLERFKIRVNDELFTQLLATLGMNDSKTISYHRFLEIFEPKEAEDHKWLNSVHRFNNSQKPLLLAWRTVEELLCSRLKNNWKEVMKAIGLADARNTGLIGVDELRAIVERYAFPVSAEHFESLLARSGDSGVQEEGEGDTKTKRTCAYDVFFERLGVNANADDMSGVSATIIAQNEVIERDRLSKQVEKRRELDAALDNRIRFMSADELLVRLKDHLMLRNGQLFDAFQAVAQRAGTLQRRDVRKLLAHIGVQLEDAAYNELLSRLRFRPDGTMTYAEFVATFAQRPGDNYGMGARLEEAANHRVNPARGDERGLDVDALERRLREKLCDNFADLRAAFRKLDETHSGTIDRAAFRKLLDSFMCVTSEAEFNKLATRFGLASRGARIDYLRFLEQFQSRDEPGAHRWLDSVHHTQAAREPTAITAEQAHRFLVEKAYSQYHDLHGAFCAFDVHSRGYVTRRDLSELLNRFQLQLAQGEFDRLWLLYDVARTGKINFAQFVDALRFAQQFAPPDLGASHSIVLNNRQELLRQADTQTHLHQQLTANQVRVGESLPLAEVMRRLTDTLHLRHADVQTAFRKCDTANKGYLNVADFVRVLEELYLYLTQEQLADLLVLFGVPSNDSHISYVQFLNALERYHFRTQRHIPPPLASAAASIPQTPSEAPTPSQSSADSSSSPSHDADTSKLSPADAEARLRRAVQANAEALHKALRAFDRLASGTVRVTELRRVLDTFCFPLSDFHLRHVLWRSRSCLVGASLEPPPSSPSAALAPLSADLRINYNEFLATFGKQQKLAQSDWLRELPRTESAAGHPASVEEVEVRIREFVAMRGALLRRAFREADYAQLGVVSRDDFVRVVRRFVMRITDQQATALFNRNFAPENEFGNILYDEFLARHGFTDPQAESASGVESERPRGVDEAIGQTERSAADAPEPQAPHAPSTVSTLLSAERVERQIRAALGGTTSRKWDELQAEFRLLDTANTGLVERWNALERFSALNIDPSEVQSVLDKYDPQSTGKFAYRSFLRNLLLAADEPADNDRAALRRKLIKSKMTFASGDKSEQFFEAMLRIRARVLADWKPLRRAFRQRDARHTGQISSLDFRAVLKKFQIVLNEEEFYHFTAYFDSSLESRVSYDEFIRTFLETA